MSPSGGIWRRRFAAVADVYQRAGLASDGHAVATQIAQPAIVTACLAALHVLDAVGVRAGVAVGHSLGELVAYHWAGALDQPALLRLAAARGQAMAHCRAAGAMASLAADQRRVEGLLEDQTVVIAGVNSPRQTVISGDAAAVDKVVARALAADIQATHLHVSHAFHSPLVADAAPRLAGALRGEEFRPLGAPVLSTVTGRPVEPAEDLGRLLLRQVTSPVRFMDALRAGDDKVDLWIEVGPGSVMRGIVGEVTATPVVSCDAGGRSLRGLLRTVATAFVAGAPLEHRALFDGRFRRPFELDWRPRFFANPCELAGEGAAPSPVAPPAKAGASSHTPEPDARASAIEVVRRLAAQRAELPLSAVRAEDRLLNDLHLSSIAVGQVFAEAARALNLPPPTSPTDAAHATVGQVAQALEELAEYGPPRGAAVEAFPAGVDAWTRAFTVHWQQRALPGARRAERPGRWTVLAENGHPWADKLTSAMNERVAGTGVVVCLPADQAAAQIDLLLAGTQRVITAGECKFVLVTDGGVGASFAKSLALELPHVTSCAVDLPAGDGRAVDWVVAEAQAAIGFSEAKYDPQGRRLEPALRLLDAPRDEGSPPLDSDDVLLASGGGKGIAAECAFALARETGVRLALLGRSHPDQDAELKANLDRIRAAGVVVKYLQADVTEARAVQSAVAEVQAEWGPVTAVLHAAGVNRPQRLSTLDRAAALATLRPKVDGLRNVLAAIQGETLRLLVTFGSIIGRAGMPGQADYALANEWLTRLTENWQADNPHCHCLALEWSVWSGVGMGERLGTVDALQRQGISPITIDDGVAALRRLIGGGAPAVAVVVTGRFGEPPTLKLESSQLPLLRFLERPRVFVPGVELVADADLALETDLYLQDHVYQGVPLLPAVIGLEAMVQAATALAPAWKQARAAASGRGSRGSHAVFEPPLVLENVRFDRPVVVGKDAGETIRVAALRRETGDVELVLRSAESDFQQDHFRAVCRFDPSAGRAPLDTRMMDSVEDQEALPLNPARDLYGGILFHRGRFRRLCGYRHLRARECVAEISGDEAPLWFGRYLPGELLLGDAAARDAVIHAIQPCIPHHTLLPVGVDRLLLTGRLQGPLTVCAREVSAADDVFVYDVDVVGPDGVICEQWTGLRLRRVGDVPPSESWSEALWGPYIERRAGELLCGAPISVVLNRNGAAGRRNRSRRAIKQVLGAGVEIHTRPDGKPEPAGGGAVSVAHADEVTMAVAGPGALACDAERVVRRGDRAWRDVLGSERYRLSQLLAQRSADDAGTAVTRVWTAVECLKKAGVSAQAPLVFDRATADNWVVLTAGPLRIATWAAPHAGDGAPLVVALLQRSD